MATTASLRILKCMAMGDTTFTTDSLIVCLASTGVTFDPDTDHDYATISANEIATGAGYTQKTKALANVTVTENTTDDCLDITCDDISWTATTSGTGSIGPSPGFYVIDDTITTAGGGATADPVVCFGQFDSELTADAGYPFVIKNFKIKLALTSS